jgi:hypothetical protein
MSRSISAKLAAIVSGTLRFMSANEGSSTAHRWPRILCA